MVLIIVFLSQAGNDLSCSTKALMSLNRSKLCEFNCQKVDRICEIFFALWLSFMGLVYSLESWFWGVSFLSFFDYFLFLGITFFHFKSQRGLSMQGLCDNVSVEREKSVLKQATVQHLYGCLSGTLKAGVTDADILVHPAWRIACVQALLCRPFSH